MNPRIALIKSIAVPLVISVTVPSWAVTMGQVDDFQDGLIGNWSRSFAGGLTNVSDGGPLGVGDSFLEIVSGGGGGAGSRMVMFNADQWTGDYESAGVAAITADVKNLGNSELDIRIAFGNAANSWYASTVPFHLPTSSGWQSVSFDLSQVSILPNSAGSDDLSTTLRSISEVRILSSAALPSVGSGGFGGARGDIVAATLGIDNINAIPEPTTANLAILAAYCIAASVYRRRIK